MDTRITHLPAVRLVGHAARVPLIHEGVNPHIAEHVASIPVEEIVRLKELNGTEPTGVLSVSDDLDPDRAEGSEPTYVQGVAARGPRPPRRGSRRSPGGCAPGPRSSRCSPSTPRPARRPATCGCRSSRRSHLRSA